MSKQVEYTNVTIATLANGYLDERFQLALEKVIANVVDPNTPVKAKRKIRMTVTIVPTNDREAGTTTVLVETILAPLTPQETTIHFNRNPRTGKHEALASGYNQDNLFEPAKASAALAAVPDITK